MSLNKDYDAAVAAVAERLRSFVAADKNATAAAQHALTALLDHPEALRVLLADAAEVARQHERPRVQSSVSVSQRMGTVEAGSTIIGYQG